MQRRALKSLALPWLVVGTAVWALTGNLSSCSDMPSQVYFRPGTPTYVGISFKNDTAVDSATWTLNLPSTLAFDSTCADGRVKYAAEVASHGCSTSDTLSGGGHTLTVSITGCTSSLPTRTSNSGLFAACFKPVDTTELVDTFFGTCTAHNNSSGDMACSLSDKDVAVADAFASTTIPATVSSNSGQVRLASFKLGTDELLYGAFFSLSSTNDNIEFLDSGNTACCALLRGSGSGCPNGAGNRILAVADTSFPAGCFINENGLALLGLPSPFIGVQVNCSNGMSQAGTTPVAIVKFCYRGATTGTDTLTSDLSVSPFDGNDDLVENFQDFDVTVNP